MIARAWRRLPVILRSGLIGLLVAVIGTTPWAVLVSLNTKHGSSIPWAVPPTVLYLWFFWRYVRGEGWPRSTAEARRTVCRANRLPEDVWGMAIVAGLLGLVAVLALQAVLGRLVTLPQQRDLDISKFPMATVFAWAVMGSVVAGVVEESAFRGYMQRPIERRHGPAMAILVTGVLFGFLHFTHPEVTLALLPFYLAVAATYGALAYLTDSILPGLVLHAGGNIFSAFNFYVSGRSEWDMVPTSKALVWKTGPDAAFWTALIAFLIAATAAAFAYAALAGVARKARSVESRAAE